MTRDSEIESTELNNPDAAAKEAAEEAVKQAREISEQVVTAVAHLDRQRQICLGALAIVVVSTLVFDMASFSIGTDYAVSETTAQAQSNAEAKLNSWAYSAFASSVWGKLMWLSAVGGIATLVYGAVMKSSAAWVPLAQIGWAALATLLMLLLFATGFPDLSAYSDAETSATLLGYWIPLAAAATATACSVQRLLAAK